MRVTLAQTSPKLNRSNLDYICKTIEEFKDKSDLIVFCELSLNGYLLQDKLYEDAWNKDELSLLEDLSSEIDIVVGGAMKDKEAFRNAALYFSKGKLLSQHNKVHLPNYGMFEEARYFKAGEIFESFTSQFGKTSMLVCEDLWHDSVHHDLIKENPDLIIALVASPARGFTEEGLVIENKWYSIIKTVASECSAELIFVNRVGFEDGLGFWGGSCIVEKNGSIRHQLPRYETIIKTFDI
ncbi:hydrolase, carbon-nitrogen family [Sulfurimonas gotlandica GD1]|uniref:Hydrolase, carbon-nitrogen family n=1 Tax=Sulfurimonas gotlandica (strain DSM 19862 / JCM 16533 / GD1) TaxID=929558 RepID=B6BMS5_SULGG|nr:nitrilase-related carbon-nitrogen hydrolase [Sulfurimonas gotlandica]EDZ61598.1 nitrilase/cyanide hydratase and apolipoprotein N-acyltransferase [Sulfurimonas gotlandica GD1]EHP30806.1 hydrolase, carbon-nitrogen family [Sulfurimonas gotlandica GD1]